MAGAREAGQEAVRIAVHAGMSTRVQRSSFGIRDARVHLESRRFAAARDLDGLLGCEGPRMIQIEIGDLARERLRLDQAGVRIFRGIASDRASLLDGLTDCFPAQVRRAGGTLAFAEVDGDPETAIALVLNGVDLPQPDGHA